MWFPVFNNKRITVHILVRYGSRYQKPNGQNERFGTLHASDLQTKKRYGHGDKFGRTTVFSVKEYMLFQEPRIYFYRFELSSLVKRYLNFGGKSDQNSQNLKITSYIAEIRFFLLDLYHPVPVLSRPYVFENVRKGS